MGGLLKRDVHHAFGDLGFSTPIDGEQMVHVDRGDLQERHVQDQPEHAPADREDGMDQLLEESLSRSPSQEDPDATDHGDDTDRESEQGIRADAIGSRGDFKDRRELVQSGASAPYPAGTRRSCRPFSRSG